MGLPRVVGHGIVRSLDFDQEKPEGPDDFFGLMRGPTADQGREYLLTLGEFLGTDVVVSDETAYEADVSDIEIEVEK